MKIAFTAPLYPLGTDHQGGIGTIVSSLTQELIRRGHEVDIFAIESAIVKAKKIAIFRPGFFEDTTNPIPWVTKDIASSVMIEQYLAKHHQNYDVIHNNKIDFYSYLRLSGLPKTITTYHQAADSPGLKLALELDASTSRHRFVAISDYQAKNIPINFVARIHNGIDISEIPYYDNPKPYLAWMGRIEPIKGIREAIDLASACSVPFKFAGSQSEEAFYAATLEYAKTKGVEFYGLADANTRNELLGNARALLYPVQWDEPFGLVLTEAMACGTPVITYDRGAVSEIVVDGVTGYVCPPNDTVAMEVAIKKIMTMPDDQYLAMRQACRKRVEQLFTIERMVDQYEALYATV